MNLETLMEKQKQIAEMNFGPGMDRLVAEKVFAQQQVDNYSTSISAATEVLEQFETFRIQKLPVTDRRVKGDKIFQCFINANKNCAYGSTMPESICKAALLAVLHKENE